MVGLILMMGVSLFLGFNLYKAQEKILTLSAQIEQQSPPEGNKPTANTLTRVYQYDGLSLKITGRNNSNKQLEQVCVFSVVNFGTPNEIYFYLNGVEKTAENQNNCPRESQATLTENGNWEFQHTFGYQQDRVIKVEELYK